MLVGRLLKGRYETRRLAAIRFAVQQKGRILMTQTLDCPIGRLKAANRRPGAAGQTVPPPSAVRWALRIVSQRPEAKVQIYTAEIVPKGWTNFHCHNGATFFIALQGIFEAHFEDGILIRAKAGDVYSEPIGKMHRGHNPHDTIPYLCVAFCVTSPDRDRR